MPTDNPIKEITTGPIDGVWKVSVRWKVGDDVVEDCVSEDHARLVMHNWLRKALVQSGTKVFSCSYDPETHATTHVRGV